MGAVANGGGVTETEQTRTDSEFEAAGWILKILCPKQNVFQAIDNKLSKYHGPELFSKSACHRTTTFLPIAHYCRCIKRSRGKGKGNGHRRTGHEGPEGKQRYRSTLSLTSALDGCGCLMPRSGFFTLGEETRYALYRRLCEPRSRSGRARRISPPPGFVPRTAQTVESLYTDWAIAAHVFS